MKIYQLGQLPEEIYPSVGGKAKGLDMLVRQGFTVPEGFVITNTDQIDEEAIYQAFDAMKAEKVSVRSSASNEDQSSASNAGQCPPPTRINHRLRMPDNMKLACSWTVPI